MNKIPVGRFAPSPTGRMHLGNVFCALMSWLSVRSRHGRWILRIEDLDPQRSRREYALTLQDDLRWLGLDWDEGGVDATGPAAPYCQSQRDAVYQTALKRLADTGLLYPCRCTRADLRATQAPHSSDGHFIYPGTCRPAVLPLPFKTPDSPVALRIAVDHTIIKFNDGLFGPQSTDLTQSCGDFVVRRADGAWAYQLAVVVDDAAMGVTEVVRGCDLLGSTAQQLYLYRLLGLTPPSYIHLPLVTNADGVRLSKRDSSLALDAVRQRYTAPQLIGLIAHAVGLTPDATPISAADLALRFSWNKIIPQPAIHIKV